VSLQWDDGAADASDELWGWAHAESVGEFVGRQYMRDVSAVRGGDAIHLCGGPQFEQSMRAGW